MENTSKIRIKIGEHEFEAEGPSDTVQAQFSAFKDLIAMVPRQKQAAAESKPDEGGAETPSVRNNGPLRLDTILKAEGRVISLTARAKSLEDAILLVILGHKALRSVDGVTGSEIIDGLKVSGQPADRIGRTVQKLSDDGYLIITGAHRGKRYRLTNQGSNKATEIAREVIATVA